MGTAVEEKFICYNCIGEAFLAAELEREGNLICCTYCDTEDIAGYSLPELADRIDTAFMQHYDRMSEHNPDDWSLEQIKYMADEWEPAGEQVIYAIMDAANISEEVAVDVQRILEDKHYSRSSAEIGETSNYHDGSYYAIKNPDDAEWQERWVDFEENLKTKNRFFSKEAAAHLKSVFYNVEHLKTYDKKPVVKQIGPATDISILFRARSFQANAKLKLALESPDIELGPPPSSHAKAGRMNASGISVFYGATNAKTALAEIRPPVGSNVTLARFDIIRTLKVLDLSALTYTSVKGSIFDKAYAGWLSRTTFLRKLSQRMTKSVMPDDEHFEYLPTQAIADFLGSEMGFDGIIFPSVQSGDGLNVALFNHASRVTRIKHPDGSKVEASLSDWDDDMEIISYSISVNVPKKKESVEDPKSKIWDLFGHKWEPIDPDSRAVSLSVDVKTLAVEHINSVEINSTSFPVEHFEREMSSYRMRPDIGDV
jgi:hypothetical protein